MKQKVKFELLQPVMCGGIRVENNFFESEEFIRGSVLRAAFANSILLECPSADSQSADGKYNYIEIKDSNGRCMNCKYNKICGSFGNMTFSYAYLENSFPAPFTAKKCKKCGTEHKVKDILVENDVLKCEECLKDNIARMENLKGFIYIRDNDVRSLKINKTLSTHTAINNHSHTADDGSLFSINAIQKGQFYNAVIDDCDTNMLEIGGVIYTGKYSSCGFGKMKIVDIQPVSDFSEDDIKSRIAKFNSRFNTCNQVSVLLLSDMFPVKSEEVDKVMANDEYLEYWEKTVFGNDELPFSLTKIFTETQLYGGFDTSKSWGNWKQTKPELMLKKGTSMLLSIKEKRMEDAIKLLTELQKNGIGRKTHDGYGQIEICHPIHCIGVKSK